jgi:hypothetical protein
MTQLWTKEEEQLLIENHPFHTKKELMVILGKTEGSIRGKCTTLGLFSKQHAVWTFLEDEKLRRLLSGYDGKIYDVASIAFEMGRSVSAVFTRVSKIELGDRNRVLPGGRKDRRKFKGNKDELIKYLSECHKKYIREKGHPKGFLGHHHSDESKKKIGEKSKLFNARLTKNKKAEIRSKINKTKKAKYGSYANLKNPYSRTHGGTREDLGMYVRSGWEANYARYLNFLKESGAITSWKYEPKTFFFEGSKMRPKSYTPDFEVAYKDGNTEYHEIKGWMDAKSKSKLRKMKKYFPEVKIILINEKRYSEIEEEHRFKIKNWEKRHKSSRQPKETQNANLPCLNRLPDVK